MASVTGTTSSSNGVDTPPEKKPAPEDFERPVAWLFGRQLIANLKWILLYTAFKNKLDPRDWMNSNIIPAADTAAQIDEFWRQWNEDWKREEDGNPTSEKEFWFDYISDTGDGQKAVYSIAYLCMSDLAVNRNPKPGDHVDFILQPDRARLEREGKLFLPRGAFLFVGGDTSYHISDYGTLANRFQNPFRWAFEDLDGKAQSVMGKLRRLLFGIPGNHDYYDSLDGFNRQFRRPANGEDAPSGERAPLLSIPTFSRAQEASYLALRLPFDWWFWGLDTEEGEIDFRQLEFFNDIQAKYNPKKLIVATPEPTTVFGKYAKEDENQSKTFKALGLELAFLKNPEPLGAGKCRLDLSGDVHHYSRHWGPGSQSRDAGRYASVMAGGGGAFMHPSHTTIREVTPEVIYPLPGVSRKVVAHEVFKIVNIWKGGFVWLFGFLIAFSIFFAANFPQSTKDAVDGFPWWINLGISPPLPDQPQAPQPAYVKPMPRFTFVENANLPPGYFLWMISLGVSLGLLGGALYYSSGLFKKEYTPGKKQRKEVMPRQRVLLWSLVFASFACLIFGIWQFHLHEPILTRFGRSLIILVALLWSVLAVVESLWYSEWLFEEAYDGNLKWWHYWPIWVLLGMPVLGFGSSLWFFGQQESAFLISDLNFLIVLLVVGLGLVYFAYGTGANLKKGAGKLAFIILGASHALLQLAVPFLLVRKGHLVWAPLVALVIVFIFQFIGTALARMENGWPLALAWIVLGALLLCIPFYLDATRAPSIFNTGALNMPNDPWLKLLLCLYAGAIGAVMSCVLFGWYLAVSLAFNGHNNEAGGAARIEGFKQFIRFRLNRHGLTGYVIAINEPNTEGGTGKLDPQIIDVFHLCER